MRRSAARVTPLLSREATPPPRRSGWTVAVVACAALLALPGSAGAQQVINVPVSQTTGNWGNGGCGSSIERGSPTSGRTLTATWVDTTGADSVDVRVEAAWKFRCTGGSYAVTINGAASTAGATGGISCSCNGSPYATTTQTFTAVAINPNGSNSLTFRHTGSSWVGVMNNSSGWALRITVTPRDPRPTISNLLPASGSWVRSTTPALQADVAAPEAGQSVAAEFSIDGGGFFAGSAVVMSGVSRYTTPTLSQGTHTWVALARDATNLLSPTSASMTLRVDSVAPTVGTPTIAPGVSNTGAHTVTWTASDATSGLATTVVQRSFDGAAPVTVTTVAGGVTSWSETILAQGSYTYRVLVTDVAGNETISATSNTLVVDRTSPTVPGTPALSSNPASGPVVVSWTASTDGGGSGFARYELQSSTNGGASWTTIATPTSASHTVTPEPGGYLFRVRALDGAGNLSGFSGTSATLRVHPVMVVTGLTSPRAAGAAGTLTVELRDNSGNRFVGYRGVVRFFSSDAAAILPGDYTFVAADDGLRTFPVTLRTSGTHSMTVTEIATPVVTGTQSGIVVTPGAAASLVVRGIGTPRTAGEASDVTIEARDAFGNRATSYRGTVRFTSTDAQALLPADYVFTATDAGLRTLGGVTLGTAGTQSVTATDTVTVSIAGSQSGIVVRPAAAATFSVIGLLSPRVAGVPSDLVVEALDAFGNRAIDYRGTVRITSTDAQAVLPAAYGFTAADSGLKTFAGGVELRTAATQEVVATDTATASLTGRQSGIVVSPAAAATLSVSGISSPRAAGAASDVTIEAKDRFGNRATGYRGTVRFTSTDAQALLPTATPFTATHAGLRTVAGVTLRTAGTQAVTATDQAAASITGEQSGIVVTPGAATTLLVSGIGTPRTAGQPSDVRVEARDAFGNRATGYRGTVRFTSTDAGAVLPAAAPFTATDAGVKTFAGVDLRTAGTHSVTATDTAAASLAGSQTGIVVRAAAPATLTVTGIASPRVAGTPSGVVVEIRDAFGNRAAGYLGTVEFTSTDPRALLPPPYTFTATDAGLKAFDTGVELRTAGFQAVRVTDSAAASLTGVQDEIAVAPAAAASLVVSGIASPRRAGDASDVSIEARDAFGNRATEYTGTIRFSSTDAQALLPAELTFTADDAGLRSVSGGVTLRTAGTQSITVTDVAAAELVGQLGDLVVTPAAAVRLELTGPAAELVAGTRVDLQVRALDAFDNVATGYLGEVTITSTDPAAELPAPHPFGADDAGARSYPAGVRLVTAGARVVQASDGTIEGSLPILVTPAAAATVAVSGPARLVAGAPESFALQVQDEFGNDVPGSHGVQARLEPSASGTFAETTLAGATPGNASISGTTSTDGSAAVAVRDTVTGARELCVAGDGIVGAETCHAFVVDPAAPDHVTLLAPAGPIVAGEPAALTFQVRDAFGNAAPAAVTLQLEASEYAFFLDGEIGSLTTTTGPLTGAITIDVTSRRAGTRTVAIASATVAGVPLPETVINDGASLEFVAGPPHAVVVAQVGPAVAGEPVTLSLRVVDQHGNEVISAADVCVTVQGDEGEPTLEAGSLAAASQPEPAVVCGRLAGDGLPAELVLRSTRAEEVAVRVTSSGLPGSGTADGTLAVVISPAAPALLRLTPEAAVVDACGSTVVQVQLVDAYDNAVLASEANRLEVTLAVNAAEGTAGIVATTLAELEVPAATVTGFLDDAGQGTITVRLDAAAVLELRWSSEALPREPAEAADVEVRFVPGPVDPNTTLFTTSGRIVEAGFGRIDVAVVPRDACGVLRGPGDEVTFEATHGSFSPVEGLPDGSYVARFGTAEAECPELPVTLRVRVGDVLATTTHDVRAVCSRADPASVVTVGLPEVPACASGDVFTTVSVQPAGEAGPMPPDQEVTVTADGVLLVNGGVQSAFDPETGWTTYTVQVGSNRCSDTPRPITVLVNGVEMLTVPEVRFTCPAVDPERSGIELGATEAPADGETGLRVIVTAVDECGNPAFARTVRLRGANPALEAKVTPEEQLTEDALGSVGDGTAVFVLSSALAGRTGVVATSGGVEFGDPEALLTFRLLESVAVEWTASATAGSVRDELTFTAKLTSSYPGTLQGVKLTPAFDGLTFVSADGVDVLSDGTFSLGALGPEGATVTFRASLGEVEPARAGLAVSYGAEGIEDRHTVTAGELLVHVLPSTLVGGGCSCSPGAGGAAGLLGLLALVGALRTRRRR